MVPPPLFRFLNFNIKLRVEKLGGGGNEAASGILLVRVAAVNPYCARIHRICAVLDNRRDGTVGSCSGNQHNLMRTNAVREIQLGEGEIAILLVAARTKVASKRRVYQFELSCGVSEMWMELHSLL
jgi:hypothetical protein